MTSIISITAVLVLAMLVMSDGGSKGLGQVKGQAQAEQGVGETRRSAGKKTNRTQKGYRNDEGKEIIARDRSRLRKVNNKPMTEAKVRLKDKFGHCDYIDLVEVGYRAGSINNCAPGGKFLFKVTSPPEASPLGCPPLHQPPPLAVLLLLPSASPLVCPPPPSLSLPLVLPPLPP